MALLPPKLRSLLAECVLASYPHDRPSAEKSLTSVLEMLKDQLFSSSSSFYSSGASEEGGKRSDGQRDVYGEIGSLHSHGDGNVSSTDVMAMLHIHRNLREGRPPGAEDGEVDKYPTCKISAIP